MPPSPFRKQARVGDESLGGMEIEVEIDNDIPKMPPAELEQPSGVAIERLAQEDPPSWVAAFKNDIFHGVRQAVQEEINPLKEDVSMLRTKVDEVEGTAKKALEVATEARNSVAEQGADAGLVAKFQELEQLVKDMMASPGRLTGVTGVVGGLGSASSAEVAKEWLDGALRKASIVDYISIYSKDKDKFNGMLFVKFPTNDSRNKAMEVFNALRTGLGEKPNFMYPDLPLNLRTESNFLRNTKNMLVDWGFEKGSVQCDLDNKSVCGAEVLKVEVEKFN